MDDVEQERGVVRAAEIVAQRVALAQLDPLGHARLAERLPRGRERIRRVEHGRAQRRVATGERDREEAMPAADVDRS